MLPTLAFLAQVADYECNTTNSLQNIKIIDWETIGSYQNNTPIINVTLNVSPQDLTLSITANLEYIGNSVADGIRALGTTYVLDFSSANAHSSPVSNPSLCSNRLSDSFSTAPFNEWWDYSQCPNIPNQIGQTNEFLAYPKPSKYWQISMHSTAKNMIVYEGKFKLNELLSCDTIHIQTNEQWLNVSGSFYVNLVSPLAQSIDVGYYRVYQLYSAPFVIAVQKTINVLSSTGISLFTVTFVAVYKQQSGVKYKLILLTESSDYLRINPSEILQSPNSAQTELQLRSDQSTANGECIAVKNNICSQMFELINNNDIACAQNLFSGEYVIRFNVECNANAETVETCENWLDIHESVIDLSTVLQWTDNICDTKTYLITFQSSMHFYTQDTFAENALQSADGLYEVGVDRVYVQIKLLGYESDDEIYDIIDIKLTNAWLCTTDPSNELVLDSQNGNGGCFASELIDEDGPYHIVKDGEVAVGFDDIDTIMYNEVDTNDIRFSFIVPTTIVRGRLYVHAQLSIDLVEIETGAQRRLIMDAKSDELNEMDQIRHYMDLIKLQKHIRDLEHRLREQNRDIHKWSYFWLTVIVSVLLLAIAAIMFAVYVVLRHYKFDFKGSVFANYSIIKYLTDVQSDTEQEDGEEERNNLLWKIMEEQQGKANSV